jgi:hypothetical protein
MVVFTSSSVSEYMFSNGWISFTIFIGLLFMLLLCLKIAVASFLFRVANQSSSIDSTTAAMQELLEIERFTIYKGRIL